MVRSGLNRLIQSGGGVFTRSHSAPGLSLPRRLRRCGLGLVDRLLLCRGDLFLALARQLAASGDALVTNWQTFAHPESHPVRPTRPTNWRVSRPLFGHLRSLG